MQPMPESPPASVEVLKQLLALRPVRLRLLRIAHNRAGSVERAEDLVSEATVILLSGRSPWRPDPGRPVRDQTDAFIVHVALLIRRCHSNRVTSAAARREKQVKSDEVAEQLADFVGDGRPTHARPARGEAAQRRAEGVRASPMAHVPRPARPSGRREPRGGRRRQGQGAAEGGGAGARGKGPVALTRQDLRALAFENRNSFALRMAHAGGSAVTS
jgi:hypothetical protein